MSKKFLLILISLSAIPEICNAKAVCANQWWGQGCGTDPKGAPKYSEGTTGVLWTNGDCHSIGGYEVNEADYPGIYNKPDCEFHAGKTLKKTK